MNMMAKFMKSLVFSLAAWGAYSAATSEETISSYLSHQQASSTPLCVDHTCCNITDTNSCSLASMAGEEVLVLPGGETRCIYSTSTPFAFQVIPGDKDKLLYYFQGGGACWDEPSTRAGFCTTDCVPQSHVGVFDRSADNKFSDYTVVHLMYCSGDIWGGSVTREYTDSAGEPIQQSGYQNARSVLDWTIQQQQEGHLAANLTSLVVMGCSAGSIGVQLWAKEVSSALGYQQASMVPDSYAGLFPDGTQGPLTYGYGMCDTPLFADSPELMDKCTSQQLTVQDIVVDALKTMPHVPFAYLQSKVDNIQISFYESVGRSFGQPSLITPADFYEGVNAIFETYNPYPNFVSYFVNGQQHCFSPTSVYYTADTLSATDNGVSTDEMMMWDWVDEMPLQIGQTISTICEGNCQVEADSSDVTYCDCTLIPKEFVESK